MDFFEAQASAKKRTSRLLALFGVAVGGTIAAAYFAAIFGLRAMDERQPRRRGEAIYRVERESSSARTPLWQPFIFASVSLGTLAVVGIASLYKWREYSAGGRAVAESLGGRRVDPHTTHLAERRLLNVVEEMAIASGTPVPAVYILDDEPAINAFAAGLTTSDAVVTVTRGTLEKLSRDELQGVIGHEFSHILNGDMRLNLRIAAAVFGILVLGLAGRGILWGLRHTRIRSSREKGGGGVLVAIVAAGVALLIIGYVGYFFGRLIQAAVSRQREFLADASAIQFTRNPSGLTGALKKIGGYQLGSTMQSAESAAIGHSFSRRRFAPASPAGGRRTHPSLNASARSILSLTERCSNRPRSSTWLNSLSSPRASHRRRLVAFRLPLTKLPPASATAAVNSVGTLTAEQIANAHVLLESIAPRLRDASQNAAQAPVLIYGILLADDPLTRARQRELIAARSGPETPQILVELEPSLQQLRAEHKLPLLQVALPSLRDISPEALDPFLDTLDELVHADGQVSTFEFALQKLIIRTLALGRTPTSIVVQYHSFHAVADEISVVLSALAHAATSDPAFAQQAFGAGAAQLKLLELRLTFLDRTAADLPTLDGALDKLARANGPIKQRTLRAAAQVVGADGQVLVTEAELLRAISAALDCPMPPLV